MVNGGDPAVRQTPGSLVDLPITSQPGIDSECSTPPRGTSSLQPRVLLVLPPELMQSPALKVSHIRLSAASKIIPDRTFIPPDSRKAGY